MGNKYFIYTIKEAKKLTIKQIAFVQLFMMTLIDDYAITNTFHSML